MRSIRDGILYVKLISDLKNFQNQKYFGENTTKMTFSS